MQKPRMQDFVRRTSIRPSAKNTPLAKSSPRMIQDKLAQSRAESLRKKK